MRDIVIFHISGELYLDSHKIAVLIRRNEINFMVSASSTQVPNGTKL